MDIEELNKYSISNEKQIEITNTIDDNNWESQNYIFSNTYNRIIPTLKLYKGINLKQKDLSIFKLIIIYLFNSQKKDKLNYF